MSPEASTRTVSADRASVAASASVSWAHLVQRHAHLQGAKPAIRFEGTTTTYAEHDQRIDAVAAGFAARGVGAGDRVAILSGNCPELLESLGAAARLGAVAVPVNFRLVAVEIAFILADSGATLLVTDQARCATAMAAVAELDRVVAVLVVGGTDEIPGTEYYEAALAGAAGAESAVTEATLAAWRAESPALIVYTSGTTGRPKGAVLTHLNLFVQTLTIVRAARLVTDDDILLCASPLFHVAAIGSVLPSLLLGHTVVLVGSVPFDPAAIVDLLEAEGVTTVFLVPTQWQALCAVPGTAERALPLRTLLWGASPAPPSTLRAMAETFPGVANVALFGQTEMSPVTASLQGSAALERLGSVGRPVATVDMRVVDETMTDVGPGGVGEIVYRGPSTMAGYWGNPDATTQALEGGWFHSGDLVTVDADGYVTVVDRAKDMIISGGENIYSAEVEAAVDGHPQVREVAVVAGTHPTWGETPVAVVVPVDTDNPPDHADLTDWLAGRLASYKKPTATHIVTELPRNASGKVLKAELRATVRARQP